MRDTKAWEAGMRETIDGYIDLEMGIVDVSLGGVGGSRDKPTERKNLAALLLNGQPFGFSWEMVDALRDIMDDHEGDSFNPASDSEIAAAHAAIDHIAALLPPREP